MKHSLRAGLYARISTADQQTLPLQIEAMREYVPRRGWTVAAGRAMSQMLGIFAEFERTVLRDRVLAGLAHAKQKGKVLGRPVSARHKADEVRQLWAEGLNKIQIAESLNIGRASVYRALETV